MARTRGEIKTLVESHTGRAKDALENSLCNTALNVAIQRHSFKDARYTGTIAITEDGINVDLSLGVTDMINIVTARILETDGTRNKKLILKTRPWWDEFVINASDNQKGWPEYGMRVGLLLYLDRPAESGLTLKVIYTCEHTFSTDNTICPIASLDIFVEHYVTAMVFQDLENDEMYRNWIASAMGVRYLIDGTIGGALADAIAADEDPAVDLKAEPYDRPSEHAAGVSVRNLVTGHEDYGNTRWWS